MSHRKPERGPSPFGHLVASDVGALAELVVCVDLIRRGYQVFRAVSPAAPCDLMAITPDGTFRVEVKAARRTDRGLEYDKPKDQTRYDVLALVVNGVEVMYRPDFAGFRLQAV